MAETLSTLSIIAFAAAGTGLLAAVFFWFFFHIPTVIGDLSGRNARRSIAKLREGNEKSGAKPKGKKKAPNAPEKPKKTAKPAAEERPETGLLAENTVLLVGGTTSELTEEGTALLDDGGETALLEEARETPKQQDGGVQLTMLEEVIMVHTDETIGL